VRAACLSPSSALLLTACEDGVARLWDVQTKSVVRAIRLEGAAYAAAFSPTGDMYAAGGYGSTLCLVRDGSVVSIPLTSSESAIWDLMFSHDGGRVICAVDDGSVIEQDVYDTSQRRVLRPAGLYEETDIEGIRDVSEYAVATLRRLGAS
jgi:WD40 repeat protein